jgi:hypothetical protein
MKTAYYITSRGVILRVEDGSLPVESCAKFTHFPTEAEYYAVRLPVQPGASESEQTPFRKGVKE